MFLSRRNFITFTGIGAATTVIALPRKNLYTRIANGQPIVSQGFGQLIPDAKGILDLPEGFQYRIISQVGTPMSDETHVPTYFDGMAAFAGSNREIILIRNHELSPFQSPGVMSPDSHKYDKLSQGGTTTLILDRDLSLKHEFVSLAGTNRNCAGGVTPWQTWITCEEDISTPQTNELSNPNNVSIKHGYNFEVSLYSKIVKPVPLVAMGRFRHEAITVDPATGYIYQTEDQIDSCLYRFRPKIEANLQEGGILEALAIEGMPRVDTSLKFPLNQPQKVKWIRLENIDSEDDTLRYEAQEKGAAIFKRGEGICYGNREIYWICTNGGQAGKGQIFRYNLAQATVELFVESPGEGILDYPDNLILSPFGDLIACEDGAKEQFLVGITPQGQCYHFARNALNNSEFAGICFAPDGNTMFINIYSPGLTLAVWGNWHKIKSL